MLGEGEGDGEQTRRRIPPRRPEGSKSPRATSQKTSQWYSPLPFLPCFDTVLCRDTPTVYHTISRNFYPPTPIAGLLVQHLTTPFLTQGLSVPRSQGTAVPPTGAAPPCLVLLKSPSKLAILGTSFRDQSRYLLFLPGRYVARMIS